MKPGFSHKNWSTGAFLLEVVFASFLFTAVLGAIVSVWVYQDRALSLTKQHSVAGLIAEKTMTRCLAAGFYYVDELVRPEPRVVEVVRELDGVEQVSKYATSIQVMLQPDEDLKLVTVLVRFTERGVEKTVELHHVLYWER